MTPIYIMALATAAAVLVAACGPSLRAGAEGGGIDLNRLPEAGEIPGGAEMDDRIELAFKKTYVYTAYLKNEEIEIDSKDGSVILSGSVSDPGHKPLAEHTAESLPGVARVENRIDVTGEEAAENSDGWIRSRVKSELLFRRNVSTSNTEFEVLDGNVTLRGEAASEAQKELTAEYVKDVKGVKSVRSEMTVAANPEKSGQTVAEFIDDASISAQVKMSLLFHGSTSALKPEVNTKVGIVMVGGEAANGAERDLVSKLVADINGVKGVVNNMTVRTPAAGND